LAKAKTKYVNCTYNGDYRVSLVRVPRIFVQKGREITHFYGWRCVTLHIFILGQWRIEGLRERTEYIDIFLFSAHHSIEFCFWCSVYWWNGIVRF